MSKANKILSTGFEECADLLIKSGAKILLPNKFGAKALDNAFTYGSSTLVIVIGTRGQFLDNLRIRWNFGFGRFGSNVENRRQIPTGMSHSYPKRSNPKYHAIPRVSQIDPMMAPIHHETSYRINQFVESLRS